MKKRVKVLVGSIIVLVIVLSLLIVNKQVNIDKGKGKIEVSKVEVETKGSKTEKVEIPKEIEPEEEKKEETEIKEIETVSSFSTLKYKINYKLESEETLKRDAIINVKINDEDAKYVVLKRIEKENITSKLKENGKELEIEVKKVETNKENSLEIEVEIKNAPSGYKFSPIVEVKEKTSEENKKETRVKEVEVKTTSIEGNVINKTTRIGEGNIKVSACKINKEICEKEKITYTNEKGRYVLSGLEEGTKYFRSCYIRRSKGSKNLFR